MRWLIATLLTLCVLCGMAQTACLDIDHPGKRHKHYENGGTFAVNIDLLDGVNYTGSLEGSYPRKQVSGTADEFEVTFAMYPDKPCISPPPSSMYVDAVITNVQLTIEAPNKLIPLVIPAKVEDEHKHTFGKRVRWQTNAFGFNVNSSNGETTGFNDVKIRIQATGTFTDENGGQLTDTISTYIYVRPYNAYIHWKTSFDFGPSSGTSTYSQVSGVGAAHAYSKLNAMKYMKLENTGNSSVPFVPNVLHLVATTGPMLVPKATVVFAFTHGESDRVFSSANANTPNHGYPPNEVSDAMEAKGEFPPTRYIFHYACSTYQSNWIPHYLAMPPGKAVPFPNNSFVVGFDDVVYSILEPNNTDTLSASSKKELDKQMTGKLSDHALRNLTLLTNGETIQVSIQSANEMYPPRTVKQGSQGWTAGVLPMKVEDAAAHNAARTNAVYWLPSEESAMEQPRGSFYVVFPIQ